MLKANKNIILLYLIILILSSIPLIIYKELDLFKKINGIHSPFLDFFFYYISFLGSGYTYLIILGILFFMKKIKWTFGGLLSLIVIFMIVKSMKLIFFRNALRPYNFIYEGIHILDFLNFKNSATFPSGHASVIFSIVILLLFIIRKNFFIAVIFYILGSLVAYSRVYLAFHFYKDVYFGLLIGGIVTTFICLKIDYLFNLFLKILMNIFNL